MHGPSRFRAFGLVTDRDAKTLTHPDDMALTWTRADMANDVSRAHGQIRVVRVGSVQVNGQLGDVVLTRRHC